jgi:ABC-2 type transport system permease protein
MNRTIKAVLAVLFVLAITFSAITITENLGRGIKVDITEQKIYTLSDGTQSILSRINQPIDIELYYASTAAIKGPDQIKFYDNYFEFVRSLLEEYESAAGGMINLEVIDPRPYSDEESTALAAGLKKFPITQDENFFFGLILKTGFGVQKTIPFFSPERQNFVEYDVSFLIDTAITREKKKIGVLSSLPVMGDDVTGYMAQMMQMQGQQPKEAWGIVEQLRQQFEVETVPADTGEISGIDILLVIHPKEFEEKTLFAIDQYVVKGGRAIVCLDPHCFADQPDRQAAMQGMPQSQASNMPELLKSWGLSMQPNTFAADMQLAQLTPLGQDQRPVKLIGLLGLERGCFNEDLAISSDLNDVRVLFAGVLKDIREEGSPLQLDPILMTTSKGNSISVSGSYELMYPDPDRLLKKFYPGTEPVYMGYRISGNIKSAFPEGIDVAVETEEGEESGEDSDETQPQTKHLEALAEGSDCAVIVYSDVDFISDMLAFQRTFLGMAAVGDNNTLLLNSIEDLSGSSDLMKIRSRGNYRRPFEVVDEIEAQAEAETAEEEKKITAQIEGFQKELQEIVSSAKQGEEDIVGSAILEQKKALELKIREAEKRLQQVKLQRREKIEELGNKLRNINMLLAPAIILVVAIVLAVYRSLKRRHYIANVNKQ